MLSPLRLDEVIASVERTGRLITVDTGFVSFGIGAEIAARVTERGLRPAEGAPRSAWGWPAIPPPARARWPPPTTRVPSRSPRRRPAWSACPTGRSPICSAELRSSRGPLAAGRPPSRLQGSLLRPAIHERSLLLSAAAVRRHRRPARADPRARGQRRLHAGPAGGAASSSASPPCSGPSHAIGVGSGTDALKLSLKALGVGHGDEVITAANTFIATVGRHRRGRRPPGVRRLRRHLLHGRRARSKRAITSRTRAIIPVHYTGYMTDMPRAARDRRRARAAGGGGRLPGDPGRIRAGAAPGPGGSRRVLLHPLKNLNVWGDGGVIVTDYDALAEQLRLLRNHGMRNRDEIAILGYNSRLDTLQAVVGNWLVGSTEAITAARIDNARYYDRRLGEIPGITVPRRPADMRCVYHLYIVLAQERDAPAAPLPGAGHRVQGPLPDPAVPAGRALRFLGPPSGRLSRSPIGTPKTSISFPCDQHLQRRRAGLRGRDGGRVLRRRVASRSTCAEVP